MKNKPQPSETAALITECEGLIAHFRAVRGLAPLPSPPGELEKHVADWEAETREFRRD